MNTLASVSAAAAPLLAGWSVHTLLLRRRIARIRLDPLTGLPGRAQFTTSARRDLRAPGAVVVLLDLDGFKAVNDTHGHAAGDAVLTAVGDRLQTWAALLGGSAGRLGGDEFAATAVIPDSARRPFELRELDEVLCSPVPFRGAELTVGASIGAFAVAGLPAPALDLALRRADEAMYAAKRTGGGWRIAEGPIPEMTTTNGRRTGRPGTTAPAGGRR
ncbi:GGDEF domain-containing protein [Streptomyces sp. ISL-11]|uniref:GGDEF domain-containing protein n=1 Tax=Streptomyces sp. ISL-11 TaxID=2819174 RepID=UPI001BE51CC8|nr:GGDEF domain-containing protein [Streptomyces sp. ISL-11]MBT2383001.1 GGDEF domain-containing protein [Streptomyces sp. ISL-11]